MMWPQLLMIGLIVLSFLLSVTKAVSERRQREWVISAAANTLFVLVLWKGGFWAVLGWPA